MGFVDEVVPRAALLARTDEVARRDRVAPGVRRCERRRRGVGCRSTSRSPRACAESGTSRLSRIDAPVGPPRHACLCYTKDPSGRFRPARIPDEYDRLRRRVLWTMPSGLYVLGSTDRGERRNGMTLNWATQVSFDPKMLAVAIEITAFTHELVSVGAGVLPEHHRPRGPGDRAQVHEAGRGRPRGAHAERVPVPRRR